MTYPPFIESVIGVDVDPLYGRWGFGESVGHVSTVYQEVLRGCYSIEHAGACLVNTVCVCFVKNMCLSSTEQAITDHAGFLASIKGLDAVSPYGVEDSCVFVDKKWGTKHALCLILVELEVL